MTSNIPERITSAELCEFFKIATPTLHNWRKKGLVSVSRGVYDFQVVLQFYVDLRSGVHRDNVNKRKKSSSGLSGKERVELARAEKLERENKLESGEVITLEETRIAFDGCATIISDAFEYLGARLCNVLSGLDDPAEIQALLWEECRDLRRLMADKFQDIGVEVEEEKGGK